MPPEKPFRRSWLAEARVTLQTNVNGANVVWPLFLKQIVMYEVSTAVLVTIKLFQQQFWKMFEQRKQQGDLI
jgi:hypothetical protein